MVSTTEVCGLWIATLTGMNWPLPAFRPIFEPFAMDENPSIGIKRKSRPPRNNTALPRARRAIDNANRVSQRLTCSVMLRAQSSRRTLPVALPIPAHRMHKRQPQCAACQGTVVEAAVIFHPSRMNSILMKVARAHVMVLTIHHPTQAS